MEPAIRWYAIVALTVLASSALAAVATPARRRSRPETFRARDLEVVDSQANHPTSLERKVVQELLVASASKVEVEL